MSVISRLVVCHSDGRVAEAVRYGFEREGADVVTAQPGGLDASLTGDAPQLVIVGGDSEEEGCALIQVVRECLDGHDPKVPILYLGNGISRAKAISVGANEFMPQPSFLRDVVTVGMFLASPRKGPATGASGDLGDYFGLYYMIRALSVVQRNGVLTLVRGLRRGELRFFEGEVTSAQVGVLHGLAALHQLLLWTEARFEFRDEQVVRRQQIPMSPTELLQDAERFLAEIKSVAAGLSPSTVFEQDKANTTTADLPPEVRAVLSLFDSNRTVADVIEDSQYRVFETLQIAQRLHEIGVLRRIANARPRAAARAALAIEEWLVDAVPKATPLPSSFEASERVGPAPGEPASPPGKKKKRGKKARNRKKKRRAETGSGQVPALTPRAAPAADWSSLLPSKVASSDGPGLSPVVPSSQASGMIEIGAIDADRTVPMERPAVVISTDDDLSDGAPREGLEQVTDTEQRDQIFPQEENATAPGALEAVEEAAEDSAAVRRAEDVALEDAKMIAQRAVKEAKAAAEAASVRAEAAAEAEAQAAQTAAAAQDAAAVASRAQTAALEAKAEAVKRAEAATAEAAAKAEAEAAAKAEAEAAAVAEAEATAVAEAEAAAEAEAEAEATAVAETEAAADEKSETALALAALSDDGDEPGEETSEALAALKDDHSEATGVVQVVAEQSTSGEIKIAEVVASASSGSTGPSIVIADALAADSETHAPEPDAEAQTPPESEPKAGPKAEPQAEPQAEPEAETDQASVPDGIAAAAASVQAPAMLANAPEVAPDLAASAMTIQAANVAVDARTAFSDAEEAFFSAGTALSRTPVPKLEVFEDLDDGYEEPTFWDRFMKRPISGKAKAPRGGRKR